VTLRGEFLRWIASLQAKAKVSEWPSLLQYGLPGAPALRRAHIRDADRYLECGGLTPLFPCLTTKPISSQRSLILIGPHF
jgi:hypothetical protein